MSFKHTLTATLIMLLTGALLHYLSDMENVHPNKPFRTFPKQFGEWVGKEKHLTEDIMDVVGVDDYFLADFHHPGGQWINLYVGFYQSQKEGDLIHSPKNCMPGAGWNIARTSLEEFEIPGTGKIKAIKLFVQKGPQKQVMLYWFQSRGRFISSEYMQKIYLVIDSITRHRTDGSFVRLIAPIVNNDEAATLNHLKGFAKQLMPKLREHIPM